MYSQGLIGSDSTTDETEDFLAAFQARIDAEEKIEPNDAMPEGYRRTLIRQVGQHGLDGPTTVLGELRDRRAELGPKHELAALDRGLLPTDLREQSQITQAQDLA